MTKEDPTGSGKRKAGRPKGSTRSQKTFESLHPETERLLRKALSPYKHTDPEYARRFAIAAFKNPYNPELANLIFNFSVAADYKSVDPSWWPEDALLKFHLEKTILAFKKITLIAIGLLDSEFFRQVAGMLEEVGQPRPQFFAFMAVEHLRQQGIEKPTTVQVQDRIEEITGAKVLARDLYDWIERDLHYGDGFLQRKKKRRGRK